MKISIGVLRSTPVHKIGRETMARQLRLASLMGNMLVFLLCGSLGASLAWAKGQSSPKPSGPSDCRVEAVDYKGWHAQQLSNRWVQLVLLPQNGGRLIQVTFATSFGSCPRATTTNSIGWEIRMCWTTARSTFENLRKGQAAGLSLRVRRIL